MWTNLKILFTVVATLAVYTGLANVIPQVESDVPVDVEIGSDVTPEQLVEIGEGLFNGAGGCTACHGLGTRAPDIIGQAGRNCATRKPEMSCKQYLHESLVQPGVFVVEGFQPIMPDMSRTMSAPQIWALVAFLENEGGEVTVTVSDIPASDDSAASGDGAAPPQPGGPASASLDPKELFATFGCIACHQLEGQGGPVGPAFESLKDLEADYLRRAILDPAADTAQGFEPFAGTMPPNFGEQMTAAQLEAIIRFIKDL